MPFCFHRAEGCFYSPDGNLMTQSAYSGHGNGLNNPSMQDVEGVGPLPSGLYTIGAPRVPIDHLGPLAMPLTPSASTVMFGREGFFLHGDNAAGNHSASDGCVIVPHWARAAVNMDSDRTLVVV